MYCCTDCKGEFEFVEVVFETHGLDTPPFERRRRCPFCHSESYTEKREAHCKYCGSRLRKDGDFCSERCARAAEQSLELYRKRREFFESSPVAAAVRELEEYNKRNATRYSYGQYFALKEAGRL